VRFLLIFFIIIPLIEMSLLFAVSDQIGGLATLSLVVLTAVIGVQILKQQGLATLSRANQRMASGELPAQEILEAMMLAAAGALLLTPGFITDTIGFCLLASPVRRMIAGKLISIGVASRMSSSGSAGFTVFTSDGFRSAGNKGSDSRHEVVEGEYSQDGPALKGNKDNKNSFKDDLE
jgi:UPF0716 protein FxsA